MSKVVVHEKKRIFDDFFKIDEARLSFERFDGTMSPVVRRLNFERGDSVAALLHNRDRDRLILVNQFKYPTYEKGPGWITETVAGMVDNGETSEEAIRREALEETGYEIEELHHISTFYVSPGGTSERIVLFYGLVSDSSKHNPGGGATSENEDIKTIELSMDEALQQTEAGKIADAKTILAILWLRNRSGTNS